MVCTAKEFNDYRHYLTRIKLQSEKILGQQEVGKVCSGAWDCAGLCCWARLCSEERTLGLGAEPAQGAELGTGSRATCRHKAVLREALLSCPHGLAEAECWPGPTGSLSTQGLSNMSHNLVSPFRKGFSHLWPN